MKTKLISYVLLVLTLTACSKKPEAETPKEPIANADENVVTLTVEQEKISEIQVGRIELRALSSTVSLTGMLDVPPQNLINITAPFGGFLRSTPLLQGMKVSKGQVIAVIENPEYIQLQQDFLDTKSQVEFLESEYTRQEALAKENVNAQKTLQKSRADLSSMKAKNNGLRAKLKMLNIDPDKLDATAIRSTIELHSTINGYVTEVNSAIGAFVNPTDVMFRIVDTEHLHAELTAFERDIPKIKIGQKIRFILSNETTERTAKVFLIGREVGADRTVRIHGHLDKEDLQLIPGQYLKAVIETGGQQRPALPEKAIVNYDDKNFVFVRMSGQPHTYQMTEVTTGIRENGFVEVTLPPTLNVSAVEVVISGSYTLLSKMKNGEEDE